MAHPEQTGNKMAGWQRHGLALCILVAIGGLSMLARPVDLNPVHQWNRALADAAFGMLCLTLSLGPLAKMNSVVHFWLPLRRELGIWLAVAACAHVAIYLFGVLDGRLLAFWFSLDHIHPVLLRTVSAAMNWVGLAALLLTVVLAATSNTLSERVLGRGWKFLQQQTYTLAALAALHTGIYLYVIIEVGHGIAIPLFWASAGLALGLQITGYALTVRRNALRRQLNERSE